jgi:hypothetical protein
LALPESRDATAQRRIPDWKGIRRSTPTTTPWPDLPNGFGSGGESGKPAALLGMCGRMPLLAARQRHVANLAIVAITGVSE